MPEAGLSEKEQKALEKEQKTIDKIIDKEDENFCGFCAFDVIDQDGYKKQVKGCQLDQTPLFIQHLPNNKGVELSASFTIRPHAFLKIDRDSNLFINGLAWYGAEKKSPTNLIGRIVPKSLEKIYNELGDAGKSFTLDFELPFLNKANTRLAQMVFTVKIEKCVPKITGFSVVLSEEDWMEWKQYKLKFWKLAKAGSGGGGGGDDDGGKEGGDKEKEKKEE